MIHICLGCNNQFTPKRNTYGKYCSNNCQGIHRSRLVLDAYLINESFETYYDNSNQVRETIRRHFLECNNNTCSKCGWNKTHPIDGKSPLELNHIDGDWTNCSQKNIEVICPNCHSLTDSYKGRNRGKGRNYR